MYNYYDALKTDITEYLADNEYYLSGLTRDELEEKLNEDLWTEDSVTGNGSGSYTFDRAEALQNLEGNFSLLKEACSEFCCEVPDSEEAADVTIRCYLLPQVLADVLDEAERSGYFEEEGDEVEE